MMFRENVTWSSEISIRRFDRSHIPFCILVFNYKDLCIARFSKHYHSFTKNDCKLVRYNISDVISVDVGSAMDGDTKVSWTTSCGMTSITNKHE